MITLPLSWDRAALVALACQFCAAESATLSPAERDTLRAIADTLDALLNPPRGEAQ